MTVRSQSMIDGAPDYYQYSAVYTSVQEAIAADLDTVDANNTDLKAQLNVATATWGLRYWEYELGIATIITDSYEIRRRRVLSKRRGVGNFSASLIKGMAEAYSACEVSVSIDIPASDVLITFINKQGILPNLGDIEDVVDNVIHAHLGTIYKFYLASDGPAYFGGAMTASEGVTIYPWSTTEISNNGIMVISAGYQAVETTTVYPI